MRRIISLGIFASLSSVLALAATVSGTLLDESCYAQQKKTAACPAKMSTTSFALVSAGQVFKLDLAGNEKASAALKARADRSTDPTHPSNSGAVTATVSGTISGDTIQVESISVQ
ncbi:MAG: hypothetical protein JST11_03465 [Acidobacteria bacterium]|nr:hypothetical protein [Acidobacteriota bacterium]